MGPPKCAVLGVAWPGSMVRWGACAVRTGGWWEGGIPGGEYYPAGPTRAWLHWYCQGPTDGPTVRYRVPRALQDPSRALPHTLAPAPVGTASRVNKGEIQANNH